VVVELASSGVLGHHRQEGKHYSAEFTLSSVGEKEQLKHLISCIKATAAPLADSDFPVAVGVSGESLYNCINPFIPGTWLPLVARLCIRCDKRPHCGTANP